MRVKFTTGNGGQTVVDGEAGDSLMRVAANHLVPGLVGECGGTMACATCHAYVEEPWASMVAPASEQERAMLEGCIETRPSSRLTCQIMLDQSLDGIVVEIPASQV